MKIKKKPSVTQNENIVIVFLGKSNDFIDQNYLRLMPKNNSTFIDYF